jgi:formylglycine-generating enzyme required for sulfatase activity
MSPRTSLVTALGEARARTDALFALIRPDSLYERPIPERHRLIFYLGHLEAFDWNQIGQGPLGLAPFHASFDKLFAFGIDPPMGQLPADRPSDWPSVAEVHGYNKRMRQALDEVLDQAPEQMLHVAVEHRLMHAETFAYILHNLSQDRKTVPPALPVPVGPMPVHTMIEIPGGISTLGRTRQDGFGPSANGAFGWDNEFDAHIVTVPAFAISKYKVTNREYLEFVCAGGAPPHFWTRRGDQWFWRGMAGDIPLPIDWPVYVTCCEAEAYARWAGKALPTEAQFHRAAFGTPNGDERAYPWGEELPDARRGNFDFRHWDPIPVTASPLGDSAFGVSQLVGNGWEWTSTPFHPLPGFQPFPFYPGYSAPFFDGAHFLMKGASPRTAARLLRRSYRNWFRKDYPYVYAGFRCVEG